MSETKSVDIEILSVADDDGRNGPQWKLDVKLPWSKYPSKIWVDKDQFPDVIRGKYNAIMARGALRDGKDPEKDWSYNWFINELNPESAPSVPITQPDNTVDSRGSSIERQCCLKAAVEVLSGSGYSPTSKLLAIAQAADFFHRVVSGNSPSQSWLEFDTWVENLADDGEGCSAWSGSRDFYDAKHRIFSAGLEAIKNRRNTPDIRLEDLLFTMTHDDFSAARDAIMDETERRSTDAQNSR